jgi:hypothetical protein
MNNVRIGLYDFFAYTVPGGMYLFAICYVLARTQTIQIDQQLQKQLQDFILSLLGIVIITIASYASGLIFDFLTSKWSRLFRGKKFSQQIWDEFTKIHPNLTVKFQASDWPILIAKIRLENVENGAAIEQNNVTNLMLRNLAFGFFLFGCIQLIEFILTRNIQNIVLVIVSAFLAFLSQKQSTKFARLFFIQIFEHTTAKDLLSVKFAEYKFVKEPEPTKHAKP